MSTKQYKLRVTTSHDDDTLLVMEERYFLSFIKALEVGKDTGKEHVHYYFTSTHPIANVRQYIQKQLKNNSKGNGAYSLSKIKEELPDRPWEYLSYLLKECTDPIMENIPEDVRVRTLAVAEETKRRVNRTRKGGKVDEIRRLVVEKCGRIPAHAGMLVNLVVSIYLEQGWTLSKFRVAEYCQTILAQEDPAFRKSFELRVIDAIHN